MVSNSEAIKNHYEFNTNIKDKPKVRVSEYAHIFGTFDFNAVTIAPPGTKIWHTKNKINVLHGTNMEYRDGILYHSWNTIRVTKYL